VHLNPQLFPKSRDLKFFSGVAENEAGSTTEFPRAKKVRSRKGKKEK
jgi:hypothetical protein